MAFVFSADQALWREADAVLHAALVVFSHRGVLAIVHKELIFGVGQWHPRQTAGIIRISHHTLHKLMFVVVRSVNQLDSFLARQ